MAVELFQSWYRPSCAATLSGFRTEKMALTLPYAALFSTGSWSQIYSKTNGFCHFLLCFQRYCKKTRKKEKTRIANHNR